jgi:hypothetical protein
MQEGSWRLADGGAGQNQERNQALVMYIAHSLPYNRNQRRERKKVLRRHLN